MSRILLYNLTSGGGGGESPAPPESPTSQGIQPIDNTIEKAATGDFETPGIISTDATLLIVILTYLTQYKPSSFVDSYDNDWTALTAHENAGNNVGQQIFWCAPPPEKTGADHTVTVTSTQTAVAEFSSWSGTHPSPADQQNGNAAMTVASLAANSITPSTDGCLVIEAFGNSVADISGLSEDSGVLTLLDSLVRSSGQWPGCYVKYVVQSGATPINPTWSWTTSANAVACAASFKPAPGGNIGVKTGFAAGRVTRMSGAVSAAPLTGIVLDGYAPAMCGATTSSVTDLGGGSYRINVDPFLSTLEGSGGMWMGIGIKVSGVAGLRPVFRFNTSLGSGSAWQGSEKGWFSYDLKTWYQFAGTPNFQTGYVEIQHDVTFTQNIVYVHRYPKCSVDATRQKIQDLYNAHPTMISNLTGGVNWVVDNFSQQTDNVTPSHTIPSKPLLGFKINDPAFTGAKQCMALYSGTHANEDTSSWHLWYALNWLCGEDAIAVALRRAFYVICLPLLNAPGRDGGAFRAQFQIGPNGWNDLNRHFDAIPSPFETVGKNRTVFNTECPDYMAVALDWHGMPDSQSSGYNKFGYTGECALSPDFASAWSARITALEPSRYLIDAGAIPDSTTTDWFANVKHARLAYTPEFSDPVVGTDFSDAVTVLQAVYDLLMAGKFGAVVVGKAAVRGAVSAGPAPVGNLVTASVAARLFRTSGATSATSIILPPEEVTGEYPDLPQKEGTKMEPRTGKIPRRSSSGKTRMRNLQSKDKMDITVVHGVLTPAQYATFMAFYAARRDTTFTFVFNNDGVSRTCMFAPTPFAAQPLNAGFFAVVAYLIEE